MSAYLLVPKSLEYDYPTYSEIIDGLKRHRVVVGLDYDAIKGMVRDVICDEKVVIARGKPVVHGVAGRLEFIVDLNDVGKPKLLPDGRVDHMELRKLVNVRAGEKLVKRIPATKGESGTTVLGDEIVPPAAKEATLTAGIGTEFFRGDENILIASVDGALVIDKSGRIEVRTASVISGDVDYSTGNVTFSGDVTIRGSVRSGFSVVAEGSIRVEGSVEDATVKSDGNMEILGGASGKKKGSIVSKGDLSIRHIENFSVKVGGKLSVKGAVLHSTLSVSGPFQIESVVGGKATFFSNGKIVVCGTKSGIKTELLFGGDKHRQREREKLNEQLSVLTTQCCDKKESAYEFVKDNMDDSGALSSDDEKYLSVLKSEVADMLRKCEVVNSSLSSIIKKIEQLPVPKIECGKIFPNTVINYGNKSKINQKELLRSSIHIIDGKIQIISQ